MTRFKVGVYCMSLLKWGTLCVMGFAVSACVGARQVASASKYYEEFDTPPRVRIGDIGIEVILNEAGSLRTMRVVAQWGSTGEMFLYAEGRISVRGMEDEVFVIGFAVGVSALGVDEWFWLNPAGGVVPLIVLG